MGLRQKIESTINEPNTGWAAQWADRLKDFISGILAWGVELFADVIGKAAAPKLRPFIDLMEATGKVPPEFQSILDEMKDPTGEVSALFAQSASGSLIGGAFGKIVDAALLPMAYAINSVTKNVILNEGQYVILWLRKFITEEKFDEYMSMLGHDETDTAQLKEIALVRLNPETIARLWVRDKTAYEHFWKDLADSGVTDERIQAFKELAFAVPNPAEVVHFMAKEAFEEDSVAKYGLDSEFDRVDLSWFEQAGVREDVAKLHWRAHWVHPAWSEITELLHRGEISNEDVYEWYRLVEIPPHWRDKLTSISWDLPNRIELRMMARYGLVDKEFLLESLKNVGLREDFRDVAADMMLVMGIRTDISTRYSKGWLDAAGVASELAVAGLSKQVQDRMYQWIVKNTSGERVEKERDLTKTDIYRGVKKSIITRPQGVELLQDMGYDNAEAVFILDLNAPIEHEVVEEKARELTKADILKAFKLAEIDETETLSRLMQIRFTSNDATLLVNLVKATMVEIPEDRSRELTKIDIVKGVKAGVITSEEGYIMLLDIGYVPADAQFILAVRVEAEAGSPDGFGEFKNLTQAYRKAQGLPVKIVTFELIQLERDVKAAQAALEHGKSIEASPKRIAQLESAFEEAKIAYHQMRPQAEAEKT